MRQYYALFTCNEWKEFSSMRLVGMFSRTELIKIIKKRVKENEFGFCRDIKEINEMPIRDIEVSLEYGHIIELKINEILN
ncbi:hypothetical protein [Alkaliphilus sp. B6464]|uniref:hypothetical protein n=1 Tax=Alkaliphilus sp. B6464 TaxID=2731219 RepID=UPI001BACCA6F|nr:hypothetical protein [Alkaliphilus sp. B6464]QUH21822.1 hypothetical protein HYG84_17960 [Alkaliphilus sp. B6464]